MIAYFQQYEHACFNLSYTEEHHSIWLKLINDIVWWGNYANQLNEVNSPSRHAWAAVTSISIAIKDTQIEN